MARLFTCLVSATLLNLASMAQDAVPGRYAGEGQVADAGGCVV